DAWKIGALVTQLAIGGIFQDEDSLPPAVTLRQLQQSLAAWQRQGQTARILEVIAHVDEAEALELAAPLEPAQKLLERRDVHALLVHRHRQRSDSHAAERPLVDEVGRRLGDHKIAWIEEQLAEQVQQLLRT